MDRTCDKCNANIPQGNPYICISHNIEFMERDVLTLQDSVTVVDSDELLVLCTNYGNRMTRTAMAQILKAIPTSQREVISN